MFLKVDISYLILGGWNFYSRRLKRLSLVSAKILYLLNLYSTKMLYLNFILITLKINTAIQGNRFIYLFVTIDIVLLLCLHCDVSGGSITKSLIILCLTIILSIH